jgi:enediyne biosynthesis protein E4
LNFLYLNESGGSGVGVRGSGTTRAPALALSASRRTPNPEPQTPPVKFVEVAEQRGCAGNENGKPDGSMGVDAADYDGSGRLSIFVTNFSNEMHALYRPLPNGQYQHATVGAWINAIGLGYVGFGTGFFDYDRDGFEDLVITNGLVARHPHPPDTRAQLPVLFQNTGHARDRAAPVRFVPVTERGGPYFQKLHMGRGLALGDLDNDGRIDIVISHSNEPVTILRNELDNGNHWLGIGLVGKPNADAIGAKVTLEVGGRTLLKVTKNGGSYLSASDPRLVFGLGAETKVGRLTVRWPSGRTQMWEGLKPDQYWVLVEGEPEPEVLRSIRTSGDK